MNEAPSTAEAVELERLQSARGVRAASERVWQYVCSGQSSHFRLDLEQFDPVVDYVARVTQDTYPDLSKVPFHSRLGHFNAGAVDRLSELERQLSQASLAEQRRCLFDLTVTSVLLDAGAGSEWAYIEPASGQRYERSEGLAVASFHWFTSGAFSNHGRAFPLRAEAEALASLTRADLLGAFQVTATNPLLGVDGRLALLQQLGHSLMANPTLFQGEDGSLRPGNLADQLAIVDNTAKAPDVLRSVLVGFGNIWPGRELLGTTNLGDVWTHSVLGRIPFHKLSQWLTYSLCDCLQRAGLKVTDLDELTGLAEYRNGGLFVDLGVIVPKSDTIIHQRHSVGSDVVIEWRALTIALLDRTAAALRQRWDQTAQELPLVKVLQGGTWSAGRLAAKARRADASPPLHIDSDGTVF